MKKFLLALVASLLPVLAAAQTAYPLFQPANGILKGQTSTYVTTPATAPDVISLWSGTCDLTTFLRADGTCVGVGIGNSFTLPAIATPAIPSSGNVTVYASSTPSPSTTALTTIDNFGAFVQLGYEIHALASNQTGSTIAAGQLVYASGGTAFRLPTIALAKADNVATMPAIGFTQYSIPNNSTGEIHILGLVTGNTAGMAAGAKVYVSDSVAGGLTTTAPSSPTSYKQQVGVVTLVGSSGSFYLNPQATLPIATSAGGTTNQVQYNNGGVLGGITLGVDQDLIGTGTVPQATSIPNCGSSTQALAYSTSTHTYSCQTVTGSGGPTGANPTGTVTLSATNGVAGTFMRSDASPPLSQAISPSWTGNHTFAPSSGRAILVTPVSGQEALRIDGASAAAGSVQSMLRNQTTTGYSSLRLYNDQNLATRALELDYAGSAYASSLQTNGPTGESAAITSTGAFPLSLGTSNTERERINSAGNITFNAASSGITFLVNGVGSAGQYAEQVAGSNTAGARGLLVTGGTTNSTDYSLVVADAPNSNNLLLVQTNGAVGMGRGGATALQVSSTGATSIAAPTSGVALTAVASSGVGTIASLQGNAATGGYLQFYDAVNSTSRGYMGYGSALITGIGIADFGLQSSAGNFVIGRAGGSAAGATFGANGNVTIPAPSSGTALSVTGVSGQAVLSLFPTASIGALSIQSASGNAAGIQLFQTSFADWRIYQPASSSDLRFTQSADRFIINANGGLTAYGPVAAAQVDMTPDKGTFTATVTGGCSTTPTTTVYWRRNGSVVTIENGSISCTSNGSSYTFSGVPAAITPTGRGSSLNACADGSGVDNTSTTTAISVCVTTSSTLVLLPLTASGTWTASGTKTWSQGNITYLLD